MKSSSSWPVPDDWTPEKALAAYDLISVVREIIWQHYQDPLLAIMIDEDKKGIFDEHPFADPDTDQRDLFDAPEIN